MTAPRTVTTAEIRSALTMFRVTAIAAGIAMFILIAEMVLLHVFKNPVLKWWSPIHGMIFMAFALAVGNLGMKLRWSMGKMAGILLAACIPFLAFVIERRTAAEAHARTLD